MAAALRKAFEEMANHMVSDSQLDYVLAATYPYPEPPENDAPQRLVKQRWERWMRETRTAEVRRAAARNLYRETGSGMNLPPCRGAAWGLYNAIVEMEDYRPALEASSAARDALFGARARAKERAFEACLAICSN